MRTRMVRMGAVAAALSLLVVAGQATIALADGGPDRVLSPQVAADRPGFGDKLMPERPGFGDNLQPVVAQTQAHDTATTVTNSDSSGGPNGTSRSATPRTTLRRIQ